LSCAEVSNAKTMTTSRVKIFLVIFPSFVQR
jgi:hypothetical protein